MRNQHVPGLRLHLMFYHTYPLYPLSSRMHRQPEGNIPDWKGELKGEGASPLLKQIDLNSKVKLV
jgi:hypothetical protein